MKKAWRQLAQYSSIVGMECSWLFIWLTLLNHVVAGGSLSPVGILSVYGFSFGFNTFLVRLKCPGKISLVLNILLWLVALMAVIKLQLYGGERVFAQNYLLALPRAFAGLGDGFRPELLVFFFIIVLWVLGFRLAVTSPDFKVLVAEFQLGLTFLLIAFMANSQIKVEMRSSVFISLVFIAFALMGVAIAHGEQGNSWLTGQNHGYWIALLFAVIILVIILGLMVSAFVTPDVLQMALIPFKLLWALVVKVMTFIASFDIWNRLLGKPVPELLGKEGPVPPDTPEVGFGVYHIPPGVLYVLRFLISLSWLAVFLIVLWRLFSVIFSWLRRRAMSTEGAEMESLNGALREDIFSLLRRILGWLFRILRLPFFRREGVKSPFPEVATVREIYRQMLSWAAAKGWPRVPFQTPYEYLYTLQEALPPFQEDFYYITSRYVMARYGSLRPDQDELSRLKESWLRIKRYEEKAATSRS